MQSFTYQLKAISYKRVIVSNSLYNQIYSFGALFVSQLKFVCMYLRVFWPIYRCSKVAPVESSLSPDSKKPQQEAIAIYCYSTLEATVTYCKNTQEVTVTH